MTKRGHRSPAGHLRSRVWRGTAILAATAALGAPALVAAEVRSATAGADTTTTAGTSTTTAAPTSTTAASTTTTSTASGSTTTVSPTTAAPTTTTTSPSGTTTTAAPGPGGRAAAPANPTVTISAPSERYLYTANPDPMEDVWFIGTSGPTTLSASIADAKGDAVATPLAQVSTQSSSLGGVTTYGVSMTWNGTNQGQAVPDGTYTVTVASPDADPATFNIDVQNEPVGYTIGAPAAGAVIHNNDPVTVSAPAGLSSAQAQLEAADVPNSDLGSSFSPNGDGSFTIAAIPGAVPPGSHPVFASVQFFDPKFGYHTYSTPALTYDLEGSFSLQSSWQPTVITPNLAGAGYGQNEAEIPYTLGVSSTVDAKVLASDGTTVLADLGPNSATAAGDNVLPWPGTDGSGKQLPSGVYTVALTATSGSSTQTLHLEVGLDDASSLASVTAPAGGAQVSGKGSVTVQVDPSISPTDTRVDVYAGNSDYYLGETQNPPDGSGVLTVPVDYSSLPAGTFQMTLSMSYTDSLGAGHSYVPIPAPSIDSVNTLQVTGGTAPIAFTATGDANHDQIPLGYTLSLPATVTSTVTDSKGQVIDTLEQAVPHDSYYLSPSLTWDTLDHSQSTATPAPAGTYHFDVSATDSGGGTATFTQEIDLARPSAGTVTLTPGSDPTSYTVEYAPADGFTPQSASLYTSEAGYLTYLYPDPTNSGSWTGSFSTSNLVNATYHLYVQATPAGGSPLDTAPQALTITNPEQLTPYSNPLDVNPADPTADQAFAGFGLAQPASVSGTVTDSTGATVATIAAAQMGDGQVNSSQYLMWDGRYTVAGRSGYVPDATYKLAVSATDAAGGSDSFTVPVTVATVQPGSVTTPAAGATIAESADAVFTPGAGYSGEITGVSFSADPQSNQYGGNSGSYLGTATVQPDGTWGATLDTSSLYDGSHRLTAYVQWSTPDGNGSFTDHSAAVPVVAFTETHTRTIRSLDKGAYVTPNVAGSDATSASLAFVLNRPATVTAAITGPGSSTTTVATMTLGALSSGGSTVQWDGLDSNRAPVADGVYTLTLSAAANGQTETSTASFGVLNEAPGTLTGPTSTVSGTADFSFSFATTAVDITRSSADLTIDPGQSSYGVGGGTAPSAGGSAYTWAVNTLSLYPYSYYPVQLPNGSHTADVVFYWTDVYGVSHTYTAPAATGVAFNVDNELKFTTTPAAGAIEFNDDPTLATYSATVGTTYATTATAVVLAGSSPSGTVVRTLPDLTLSPQATVTWDGKDDHGQNVGPGNYLIHVTATDSVGTTGTQDIAVEVLAGAPGSISSPGPGSTVTGQQDLVWKPAQGVTTNAVYFTQNGQGLGQAVAQADGTYVLGADVSQLGDGSYTFGVQVDFQTPWAVTDGAYYTYHATETVMVDNAAGISDLPASEYILPNSGFDTTYQGYFATTARGLSVVETVVPDGQQTPVRSFSPQTSIGQDPNGGCSSHRVSVNSGGSSSSYTTYDCERVTWDGRDDQGNVVPDGLYDIVLTVTGSNGSTATGSIEVGVASGPPVVVTPAPASTVSDSVTMDFAPAPGYPALLAGQSYPSPDPAGVVSVETGYSAASVVQATQSLSTGDFSAVIDLPASAVNGAFTMDSVLGWTDPFGVTHQYHVTTPLQTDEHTLTLSDDEKSGSGYATLKETFDISSQAADGQPISYSITDGITGDQPITGTIPAPAAPGGTYSPVAPEVDYHQPGTYSPEIVVTDAEGHRRHDFLAAITVAQAPPTAGLSLSRLSGVAPLAETATITGSQPNGDPLTYTVDWGDGTATSAAALTDGKVEVQHSYTDPSTDPSGYLVTAQVTDGTLTTSADGAHVKVGTNVALAAAVADTGGAKAVNGSAVQFDAGVSQPALGITDYTWEYPPAAGVTCPPDPAAARAAGCTVHDVGTDPTDSYSFPDPGTYDAVLIVTDPDQSPSTSSTTETVQVLDKATTSVSTLQVGETGANVKWIDSSGAVEQATDLGNGDYQLLGLPAGDTTIEVYKSGFQPATATVTVQGLVGSGSVVLVPGGVGVVDVNVVRVTNPDVITALGVNMSDPANSNDFEVDASIAINSPEGPPEPLNLSGVANDSGTVGFVWSTGPGQPVQSCSVGCVISVGGGRGVVPEIAQVGPKDKPQKALILVDVPITGKVLKEFYEVSATIQNLAPTPFTFTDGQATLELGAGLSLPDLNSQAQPATQTVPDIPAGQSQKVGWVVRGDQAGDPNVTLGYTGTLALDTGTGSPVPVEQRNDINLQSLPAPVHVYGLTGLKMHVQVGSSVTAGTPFFVNVGLENTTPDADYLNASVSMQPPTATCPPGQQDPCWVQLVSPTGSAANPNPTPAGFADIKPGQTVYQQFQLLPTFSGQVDFTKSTASQVAGQQMAQPVIETITDEPGAGAADQSTFSVAPGGPEGQDILTWSPDPNALGYDVYVTSNLAQGFGDPVATVDGSDTTTDLAVPAQTASARLGASPPPGLQLVATVPASSAPSIRLASAALAPASGSLQQVTVLIGTKLADGIHFTHKDATAEPGYGAATVTDPTTGSKMQGQVNSKGPGLGWTTQVGTAVNFCGFEIDPGAGGYVELDLTTNTLIVHGSGSVGLSVPGGSPIPLYTYSRDFSWNLTKSIPFNLTTANLLGMPVPAGATGTVTLNGAGANLATTVTAPALLGGASANLNLQTSLSGGVQLKGASINLGSVSIGQLAGAKVTLNYSGTADSTSWAVTGSLSAPGASANDVTGQLTYDSSGNMTSGGLSVADLSILGLGTASPFALSTTDGKSWTGSGQVTGPSGAAAQGSFSYSVDPASDTVTKASVSVSNLTIPGLFSLSSLGLGYTGGPSPTWTVAGSGAGKNPPTIKGTLSVTDGQGIASGGLTLANLSIGGIATINSAALDYDAGKGSISGNATLSVAGSSTNPQVAISIQGGSLQALSASGISANAGVLSVTGAAFSWDPTKGAYKLSATDAGVLGLGHLNQLDLSAVQNGAAWAYDARGTITAVGGSNGSLSGSITYDAGQVTAGSLDVSGLNIVGLVPISKFTIGYSASKWTASLAAQSIGSGSVEVDLDGTGVITGGSLSLKQVNLGPATIDLSATLAASGDWSFSGAAKLIDGSNSSDFSLSADYQDGNLQSASLGGHIALGKLVDLGLDGVSYDAETDTFTVRNASITLPGPGKGTLTGSISITNGQFTSGTFGVQVGGSGVPLGDGIFLTGGSVTLSVSPLSFGGQVDLAAGPVLPVLNAAALTGSVGISYSDHGDGTGIYTLSGSLAVAATPVSPPPGSLSATFTYDTGTNEATLDATFQVNAGAFAQLTAGIHGDFTDGSFELDGQLQGSIVNIPFVKNFLPGSATGWIHLDNSGVSACAYLGNYSWQAGLSYQWGQSVQFLQGCDIGNYSPVGATAQARSLRAAVRAAAIGTGPVPSTFTVASGQDVAVLKFVGTTAAPIVTLDSPDGGVFTTPADPSRDGSEQGGRYIVFQDQSTDTTYFLINAPAGGTWTDTIDASTPAASVQEAAGLPLTSVTAALSGSGSGRTLDYTVTPVQPGQQVVFIESAGAGRQTIGAPVTDGSGRLTFTPLAGTDTHTISAEVLMNGLVRTTTDLLTYSPAGGPVVVIPPVTGPGGSQPGPTAGGSSSGPTTTTSTTAPTTSPTKPAPPTTSNPLPPGSHPVRDGDGYWLVGRDGSVSAFGSATDFGSLAGVPLSSPVVGMAATPDDRGYWLVAADGGVFAFGDAGYSGSTGGIALSSPVVGIASTPDGGGYWLVAADGGVFAFGDAGYSGSTGGTRLVLPVVGLASTADGGGYWLVASDGGVFAFGDARFFGSTGGIPLDRPVIAITPAPDGQGYTLTASDGGVFAFGDARFLGSTGGQGPRAPVVGGVGH